jgi:hypothetical protein
MRRSLIFKPALLISILMIIAAVLFRGSHITMLIFILVVILHLVFIISALYEIYGSQRLNLNEKIMWTIGFIIASILTGLLYLFMARPGLLREYKILDK